MADRESAAEAYADPARLSTGDVQGVLPESTGSLWLKLLKVFRDSQVDGASLADHMTTAATLRAFLLDDLECDVNLFVAKQLRNKLLLRAAQVRVDHTAPPTRTADQHARLWRGPRHCSRRRASGWWW